MNRVHRLAAFTAVTALALAACTSPTTTTATPTPVVSAETATSTSIPTPTPTPPPVNTPLPTAAPTGPFSATDTTYVTSLASFVYATMVGTSLKTRSPLNGKRPSNKPRELKTQGGITTPVPPGIYLTWNTKDLTFCVDNHGTANQHVYLDHTTPNVTSGTCATGPDNGTLPTPEDDPRATLSSMAGFISSGIVNGTLAPAGGPIRSVNGVVPIPTGYTATWDKSNGTYCVDNSGTTGPQYKYDYLTGSITNGTCE